jgi:hypothetical protein
MTFRLLLTFAVLLLSLTAHAADCVKVVKKPDALGRLSEYASIIGSGCGALKVVDRRRNDPRKGVNIYATYAVFDPSKDAAEGKYNDWIGRFSATMTFSGDVDLTPADNHDETMSAVLYRSPRLLSAATRQWGCCGAHGSAWSNTLNIDAATGKAVRLDELVDVVAVATFCWQHLERGERSASGFEGDPPDSFVDKLRSGAWSVREAGLLFDFGFMQGYADGYFTCQIETKDLRRVVKRSVSVPF